ncbi:hypothetical protein VPH35_140677 [Triticum aestivum]
MVANQLRHVAHAGWSSADHLTAVMDDVVKHLKKWLFRIAVIISLVAHVYLILFVRIRRSQPFPFRRLLRALLWVAYQLPDWAPAYVLGNLYLEERSDNNLIVAFWVPFLLLNIRPDNMSGYASEDNKLSIRKIVSSVMQILGAIYVLFRHDITGTSGTLRCASIIMYVYGIAKYVENFLALHRGDLKGIRKRISSYGSKDILKVVEMEVQLLYDLIYTKTAVVYTWHGYLLRLASPFLTAAAIVLFSYQCQCSNKVDPENIAVTITLLSTTFVLDLMWLFMTLGSTWTYAYLKDNPGHWLHPQVNCGGMWHQLRRILLSLDPNRLFVIEPTKYSSWPDKTEQLSMFILGSTGKSAKEKFDNQKTCEAIPRARRNRQPEDPKLMGQAKDLLFSRIWESFKSANSTSPEGTPAERSRPPGEGLEFGPEIQEVMLSWHMAAEMFLLLCIEDGGQISSSESVYVKAVRTLSKHVIFLADERPEMLPGLEVHTLFESTNHTLEEVWRKSNNPDKPFGNPDEELARILLKIGGKYSRKQETSPPKYVMKVYQCRCIQENNCILGCQCHCHAVQENPCDWSHQSYCHAVQENPCDWNHQSHCQAVQENPCNRGHQSCCDWSCDGTGDPSFVPIDLESGKEEQDGSEEKKQDNDDSQDQELTILDDPAIPAKARNIILAGVSFCEVLIHVASGAKDMSACLDRMEEKNKYRFLKLMPEFRDSDKLGKVGTRKPVILDLMFDTWVRMVIHASLLCSRDSHEKQLGRGSEFLTTIWMLSEHAKIMDHID